MTTLHLPAVKRDPGRPRKVAAVESAPVEESLIPAGTKAKIKLTGDTDHGMVPYIGVVVEVVRSLGGGLYEVTTGADSMALSAANLDTTPLPSLSWAVFMAAVQGKTVTRCWFPNPPTTHIAIGNDMTARVLDGEPAYQLSSGEVVTL